MPLDSISRHYISTIILMYTNTCWKGPSKKHVEQILWSNVCLTTSVKVESAIARVIASLLFAACKVILLSFFWITQHSIRISDFWSKE